jgi:hypothetical protein
VYNAILNKVCIEELKEYVNGKRVLLVGNAATIFSDKHHGELIDSYDVVLRFGKGVPYSKYKEYLGTKRDIWFFGSARAGMWQQFLQSRFRILTMSQINLYKDDEQSLLLNKRMFDGSLQVYRDFMLTGNTQYMYKMVRDIHGKVDPELRLSQGAQAVHFFDKVIKTQKSISLAGFDFFEHEFRYAYEVQKTGSRIPKEHVIGSWHCPLTAPGFVANPHTMKKEVEYFNSIKNLHVHRMPDQIDQEVLGSLIKELRGEKAQLLGVIRND